MVLRGRALLSGSEAVRHGCGRLLQLDRQLHHRHVLPVCRGEYVHPERMLWKLCSSFSTTSAVQSFNLNFPQSFLRTSAGHTSSSSSLHSFSSSSSSPSSGCQRRGARRLTRLQPTSPEWRIWTWSWTWTWTWIWTSPAPSWTTWARRVSIKGHCWGLQKRENWVQLGANCVYETDSKLKLLLFSDTYNEVDCCIHIDCCAKAELRGGGRRDLLSIIIRGKWLWVIPCQKAADDHTVFAPRSQSNKDVWDWGIDCHDELMILFCDVRRCDSLRWRDLRIPALYLQRHSKFLSLEVRHYETRASFCWGQEHTRWDQSVKVVSRTFRFIKPASPTGLYRDLYSCNNTVLS